MTATPQLDPSDFESLRRHVVSIFPNTLASLCVTPQQQADELQSLNRTIGSERFFFVVDLTNFEITYCAGVQRWLNYRESDFTLKKYWRLVHPGMQKAVHTVFMQLCQLLCTGRFELAFMVQRYSSLIALRHSQGHYRLAKRTASVFQYDQQNRLTEYLNEFTLLPGEYDGASLSPSFFNQRGEEEEERGKLVMQKTIEQFLKMNVFSEKEMQVARMLAYEEGLTQRAIAASMKVAYNTVHTYCERLLKKGRSYFEQDFSTANEVAHHLRNSGLL